MRGIIARREADAVVGDGEAGEVVLLDESDGDGGGVGVFGDVGEGLLGDADEGILDGGAEAGVRLGSQDAYVDVGAGAELGGAPAEGGEEAVVVEHGRAEFGDDAADALGGLLEELEGVVEAGDDVGGVVGVDLGLDDVEVDAQGGELLANLVVELAGEAAAESAISRAVARWRSLTAAGSG